MNHEYLRKLNTNFIFLCKKCYIHNLQIYIYHTEIILAHYNLLVVQITIIINYDKIVPCSISLKLVSSKVE